MAGLWPAVQLSCLLREDFIMLIYCVNLRCLLFIHNAVGADALWSYLITFISFGCVAAWNHFPLAGRDVLQCLLEYYYHSLHNYEVIWGTFLLLAKIKTGQDVLLVSRPIKSTSHEAATHYHFSPEAYKVPLILWHHWLKSMHRSPCPWLALVPWGGHGAGILLRCTSSHRT